MSQKPNAESASVLLLNINDDFFFDFAKRLKQRGVRIHTIVTWSPERFQQDFEGVNIIECGQLHSPEHILSLNDGDPGCLSAAVIERFAYLESLYLTMTDRLSFKPSSVRFRVQLFRELLRFWYRFFEQEKGLGTSFQISAPHMASDIVAFHVAKSFEVNTLFLDRTLVVNRVLLLNDYSEVPRVPEDFMASASTAEVRESIQPDLRAAINEPSPWSRHSAAVNAQILNNEDARPRRRLQSTLSRGVFASATRWLDKLQSPTYDSAFFLMESPPTYQVQLVRRSYRRRTKRLRELYEGLCQAQQAEHYVFLALHLQPERSTCPQGGVYEDQLLAVRTAAKALPTGYKLLVKEHPRQFSPAFLKCRHYRDEDFYRRLAAIPNVRLVPLHVSTQSLLDGALAAATTTGSVGWESLTANKPCLVFGSPWYAGCRSCYLIRSLEDCRAALEAAQQSTPQQVERDVLLFISFIQKRLIYTSNGSRFAEGAPDYDVLVDNLSSAVAAQTLRGACPTPD